MFQTNFQNSFVEFAMTSQPSDDIIPRSSSDPPSHISTTTQEPRGRKRSNSEQRNDDMTEEEEEDIQRTQITNHGSEKLHPQDEVVEESVAVGNLPLHSLAKASVSMVPLANNLEEDLTKSMLCRLHQCIYQHLQGCNMNKTAASFLEESEFFPYFKADRYKDILGDSLSQSWSLFWFSKQNQMSTTLPSLSSSSPQFKTVEQLVSPNVPPLSPSTTTPSNITSGELSEKKNSFACRYAECKASFTTFANMKRHEKLHTGERPYTCSQEGCGKSFARKYDLKVHMRIHTKERPYACQLSPDCNKSFSRISSLREHERNVHGTDTKKLKLDTKQPSELEVQYFHQKGMNHSQEEHSHRPGCGHIAINHNGHADFIMDAHLYPAHGGNLQQHILRESSEYPVVCAPIIDKTIGHHQEHTHGPNCGHEAIQHEDHLDYIVDNLLHHYHEGHCDHHGNLQLLSNVTEVLGQTKCTVEEERKEQ